MRFNSLVVIVLAGAALAVTAFGTGALSAQKKNGAEPPFPLFLLMLRTICCFASPPLGGYSK